MSGHLPVMLHEAMEALAPRSGGCYVDGTFGGGSYSKAILGVDGTQVLGIDRDPEAIGRGAALQAACPRRLRLVQGTFSHMETYLAEAGMGAADGVVLDLGVSSYQFDQPERGFSLRADGPLDMRMSLSGPTAADLVNTADERTLADILLRYGEERKARAIANAIVKARPLARTAQLAELVARVLGPQARAQAIHPATRTFQALRIHINDELGELERALAGATRILAPEGRLVVVCFHSLEDRIVKRFLLGRSESAPKASRHRPNAPTPKAQFRLMQPFPRRPSEAEIAVNPRARSARMRAAVKLAA
jgi:16S rRNA (cytosine1402-N4)-methyltransferase